MALPLLIRDSLLMVSGPLESAAYVAMTEDALQLSKLTISKMGAMWAIPGQQRCHLPKRTVVEGDWSNTAFFLCMGALSKAGVTVEGLNLQSSQGDRGVLDVLRRFGAEVTEHGDAVTVKRGALHGVTINAAPIPDLIPVLSVVASVAEGETRVENAYRLRLKESDRLKSTADLLRALGGQVEEKEDGLVITGVPALHGGAVEEMTMDEYLLGVLRAEMPASFELEALKAQAVCARTYAVCQTKHRAQGFDICATTHCQVYQGTAASGANSDAAVDQTAGEFLYYSGRLVQEAVYYSSNGGASEDSLNVWGNDVGYLKGKIDPYEGKIASIIPRYNWSTTFTASELTTLLNNRGYGIGTVKNAYVSAYTDTGNVYSVTFTGTSGSKTVSREACRSLLNLRSQRFTISGGGSENAYSVNDTGESVALSAASAVDSSGKRSALSGNVYVITSSGTSQLVQRTTTSSGSGSFVISGSGYGHNVGMSQWGAYSMANLGYSYRDILQFYYTDVSIR